MCGDYDYIHRRPDWPDFRWDDTALSEPLGATRHNQGQLLGRMRAQGFELQLDATLAALTSDVVMSSAIEGDRLDPDEVRSSIANHLGLDAAGLPQPGRHVEGVVEMTLDATRNFGDPLTVQRLCGWHAALFPTGFSNVTKITVGDWRLPSVGPMLVVSGRVGGERVHFEAPDADRIPDDMTRFIEWFNGSAPIDPVLKAGIAHLWFVTIHPFEDGNGRIARAIGDMALARADHSSERYYSLSAQIASERKAYYEVLERTQRGDLDITTWLLWFIGCLDRAIDNAGELLSATLFKARLWNHLNKDGVNERQRKVINRLLNNFKGDLTTKKYTKIAKCSPDTALRDITDLINRGVLIRNDAGGRSTSYRLVDGTELIDG